MNKIDFKTGGHRVGLEDMKYIYDLLKEAFQGVSLGVQNAILSGCRQSFASGTYTVTAGFMSLNGEIYYFPGQTYSGLSSPCYVPYESVDTGAGLSPVSYADLTSQDVHFKRRVRIEEFVAQPEKYYPKDLYDYGDSFHLVANIADIVGGYAGSSIWGDPSGTMLSAGHEALKIRKVGRYIELVGAIQCSAFDDETRVFVLPTITNHNEYKPSKRRSLVVSAITSDGTGYPDEIMNVDFRTNGDVFVGKGTYTLTGALALVFNHRIEL